MFWLLYSIIIELCHIKTLSLNKLSVSLKQVVNHVTLRNQP